MHIVCTRGTPKADMLDHLPTVPLLLEYLNNDTLPEQDELWIYHILRLPDRVRYISLNLPPSTLDKIVVLMDKHFPVLEDLSLLFTATVQNSHPLTLPKAFLAPNLRRLTLPGISPPRRLWVLTSTISLVTLNLSNIQISSYVHPRLLVARLRSLPQLENLFLEFYTPLPRPSTERELLGEQGAPVTLPSLKMLQFKGVGAYLESLVAQIRAPLLERLWITLFNQIAFALPHLSYLINITKAFKLPGAVVGFDLKEVYLTTVHDDSSGWGEPFSLRVICKPFDWQIDCAAQICHAFIPALSCVEQLTLYYKRWNELQNGEAVYSATWHDLLRSFLSVQRLCIDNLLLEELSHVLQVDGVGSDPGFLPNLHAILARRNVFTAFIDARQVVGRPVHFSQAFSENRE